MWYETCASLFPMMVLFCFLVFRILFCVVSVSCTHYLMPRCLLVICSPLNSLLSSPIQGPLLHHCSYLCQTSMMTSGVCSILASTLTLLSLMISTTMSLSVTSTTSTVTSVTSLPIMLETWHLSKNNLLWCILYSWWHRHGVSIPRWQKQWTALYRLCQCINNHT